MKIDVAGFLWNTGVRSIICLCLNELRYPSIEYDFFSFQSKFLHHLFVKLTFISAVLVPGFFFRGLSQFCNFSWSNRLIYGQFNFLEIFLPITLAVSFLVFALYGWEINGAINSIWLISISFDGIPPRRKTSMGVAIGRVVWFLDKHITSKYFDPFDSLQAM